MARSGLPWRVAASARHLSARHCRLVLGNPLVSEDWRLGLLRVRRHWLATGVCALSFSADPVLAQPSEQDAAPTPEQAPAIVAPVPVNTDVSYPASGHGSHEVILELVVESDGTISNARVVQGQEPFAGTARTAALAWRFKPASANGRPVSARIRFLVRFEQEEVVEQAPEPEEQAPRVSENAVEPSPLEIEVYGRRAHPTVTSFTRAEADQLPGAFGDPTRTLDMMPGVSPVVSALPLFFVRGSPPGNVGFFIDGVRIPLLYHVFLGPSVVHPAMIERVDLYAAAYPANYGRFAGAVVAAELAEPEGRLRGEGSVRLLDSGALIEAPFAGGRGAAIVGGRYSYTGLIISQLTGNQLNYWDYQGLVNYDLTSNTKLGLFAFGALDYLDAGDEDVGGTLFHRIDLRVDHQFTSTTEGRVAVTWGYDKTLSDVGFVSDRMLAGRAHIEHRPVPEVGFRAGFDVIQDAYELEIEPAASERIIYETLFPTRTDQALGAFAEMHVAPAPWYSVTPGVRVDMFRSLGATEISVDPRLTANFQARRDVRLFHALGLAHQTPNFVPAIPGAQVAGVSGGLQRTIHSASGVALVLPMSVELTVSYFQNAYLELTDPAGLNQSLDIDETSADRRATGHAYGIEVHAKRRLTEGLGGVLSYTLSRTTRSYADIKTLSAYDRTHLLNAAVAYELGRGWQAGTRLAFASGIPGGREVPPNKVYDASRSRPYVRLDLKLQKRWQLTGSAWWGVHAEVLNANAGTEVIRRTCGAAGCDETTAPVLILPSVGVEGAF